MLYMPQARFLEFLVREAQCYPCFRLILGARVESLIEQDGMVRGVRYRDQSGWHEVHTPLTIGADGRFSKVRQLLGFRAIGKSQPRDLLWFRLPRMASDPVDADGIHVGYGLMMTVLGRPTEWQVAFWVSKGGYQSQRAAGLQDLRESVTRLVPWLADRIDGLQDWQQIAILTVESARVRRWYRPGALLIGDAAHVMSPVGGVGINLSIQDAVVASRVLGPRLQTGTVRTRDLAAVQRRRELPTRLIQFMQDMTLRQVIAASQDDGAHEHHLPPAARLAQRLPVVAAFRDRLFANGGFQPERVKPHSRRIHAVLGVVLLVLSAACATSVPNIAPSSPPPLSVKVADPLNVSGAPIYLAQDLGYFRSEGLEVELVSVTQAEVVQDVATGQLQFGLTLPSPFLFNALERGIAVRIVASGIVNQESDRPLIAPLDSAVQSLGREP
jgi:2-polyprenyl-6-methoxyphenol hydroxylase-like FAD-dependent oxidoreductase